MVLDFSAKLALSRRSVAGPPLLRGVSAQKCFFSCCCGASWVFRYFYFMLPCMAQPVMSSSVRSGAFRAQQLVFPGTCDKHERRKGSTTCVLGCLIAWLRT